MRWQALWFSLIASMALAFGLVQGVLAVGMKDQLNLMLPILPLFNAIIFPVLEKLFPSEEERAAARIEGRSGSSWTGALDPILLGFLGGLGANVALDAMSGMTYRHFVLGKEWSEIRVLWMSNPLGLFDGALNPFAGPWRLVFLLFELVVVSAVAGLCAGLASGGRSILNGLLMGAFLCLWMGSHQYLSVYETLLSFTGRIAGRLLGARWDWNYGMLLVLFLQVFLCALFSGMAFRWKQKAPSARTGP